MEIGFEWSVVGRLGNHFCGPFYRLPGVSRITAPLSGRLHREILFNDTLSCSVLVGRAEEPVHDGEGFPLIRFPERTDRAANPQRAADAGTSRFGLLPFSIGAGEKFSDRIETDLPLCRVFLLLWSQHAAGSPHVAREINIAADNRLEIYPFRLDDHPARRVLDKGARLCRH